MGSISAVWKFPFTLDDISRGTLMLRAPSPATVLSVGIQPITADTWQLCVWVLVDPDDHNLVERQLVVTGTGHKRDGLLNARFIGTLLLHDGQLVLHVFELPNG